MKGIHIHYKLRQRELGNGGIYRGMFPNTTLLNVEHNRGITLMEFSPCGRYLIGIDIHNIYIYEYSGYNSDRLFRKIQKESMVDSEIVVAGLSIYDVLRLKHTVKMGNVNSYKMNSHKCLFTKNGKHVILTAVGYDIYNRHIYNVERISLGIDNSNKLALITVEMNTGVFIHGFVTDIDAIRIHNLPVMSLHDNTLAVISIVSQCIHILNVDDNGILSYNCQIGRYFRTPVQNYPTMSYIFSDLRQKIMTFLYERAKYLNDMESFSKLYSSIMKLRMSSAKLIDDDHLLIIMEPEVNMMITMQKDPVDADPESKLAYIVIYNYKEYRILEFVDVAADRSIELFERYFDYIIRDYTNNSISNNERNRNRFRVQMHIPRPAYLRRKFLLAHYDVWSSMTTGIHSQYTDPNSYRLYINDNIELDSQLMIIKTKVSLRSSLKNKLKVSKLYCGKYQFLTFSSDHNDTLPIKFIIHPRDPFFISLLNNNVSVHFFVIQ